MLFGWTGVVYGAVVVDWFMMWDKDGVRVNVQDGSIRRRGRLLHNDGITHTEYRVSHKAAMIYVSLTD